MCIAEHMIGPTTMFRRAARQFAKAAGILEHVEPPKAAPYFRNIAQHYEASGSLEEAERYWLRADAPMEAVEMYNRAGGWLSWRGCATLADILHGILPPQGAGG